MNQKDRTHGCLLGLAVGDAIGMPVEARRRGSFEPITSMVGGGAFNRPAGHWTDDTAMAICLAESLLDCEGFDARDQMDRYCRWARRDDLGDTGTNFDIGMTIASALARYMETAEPFAGSKEPDTAGNGCIMRLAPVPMYFRQDVEAAGHWSGESSRTTHGTAECVDASRLFGRILSRALQGASKPDALFADADDFSGAPSIEAIARGGYVEKSEDEIKGTGYVVESLEAALWCFHHAADYRSAVLMAANLGEDADTTAAVCGQVAGAHYGSSAIPSEWLEPLLMRDNLEQLAARFD